MQPKLKKGQYITPLNVTPLPNITCTLIPQTGAPPAQMHTWKLYCSKNLHIHWTDILPWSFLYSELVTSAFLKMRDTLALYPEENMVLLI